MLDFAADRDEPELSVILEVQLGIDADKQFSWPAYHINHRARSRCRTCVLVVTPSAEVAAWARRPIDLGPGNEAFNVLVIGPNEVPVVTDPGLAAANPPLAFLSLLAHHDACGAPTLFAILAALDSIDKANREIYLYLILGALGDGLRQVMEAHVTNLREQFPDLKPPPFLQRLFDKVADEAAAEAAVQASARTEALAVLKVLESREIAITPEQTATITSCDDARQLDTWIRRAGVVDTAAQLFE